MSCTVIVNHEFGHEDSRPRGPELGQEELGIGKKEYGTNLTSRRVRACVRVCVCVCVCPPARERVPGLQVPSKLVQVGA